MGADRPRLRRTGFRRGRPAADATAAVKESYANDIGDEFVEPAAIAGYQGMPRMATG